SCMIGQDSDALHLATAILSGAWSVPAMARRLAAALGRRPTWLRPLARRVIASFGAAAPRPRPEGLARYLGGDLAPRRVDYAPTHPHRFFWVPEVMAPAAGTPATWQVPALTSPGALAEWLGLDPAELDWFADYQRRLRHAPSAPLQHY